MWPEALELLCYTLHPFHTAVTCAAFTPAQEAGKAAGGHDPPAVNRAAEVAAGPYPVDALVEARSLTPAWMVHACDVLVHWYV